MRACSPFLCAELATRIGFLLPQSTHHRPCTGAGVCRRRHLRKAQKIGPRDHMHPSIDPSRQGMRLSSGYSTSFGAEEQPPDHLRQQAQELK